MKYSIVLLSLFGSMPALACEREICSGDRVNFGAYVGTAVEAFGNGNVKIAVDGYSGYTYKTANELGKGVPCFQGVCAEMRVNFGVYAGTAAEVFSNGNVKIAVDGYYGYTYKTTRQIGVGYRCSGGLCQNDRVNFGVYAGTAVEIFSNGNVKISVDGYSGYTYKTTGELGYELRCYN